MSRFIGHAPLDYNATTDILSLPPTVAPDGRTYIVMTSGRLFPEMAYRLCSDSSDDERARALPDSSEDDNIRTLLQNAFVAEIVRKARLQINSFFKSRDDAGDYCRAWVLFHHWVDDKESLQGPWTSDDLRFNGIEYTEPALPLRNPSELRIACVLNDDNNIVLEGEIDEEAVVCIFPLISKYYREDLRREVLALQRIQGEGLCIPKLKYILGFQHGNKAPRIVGYALEKVSDGTNLANTHVPERLRSQWQARLKNTGDRIKTLGLTWRGRGPMHIVVGRDREPYFDRLCLLWDNYGNPIPFDDSKQIRHVLSVLSDRQNQGVRRSTRIRNREKLQPIRTCRRRRGKSFIDLPMELREIIYGYLLVIPENVLWAFGKFKLSGHPPLSWNNDGLLNILQEARSFFYNHNHFAIHIHRLHTFLEDVSKVSAKLRQITLLVNAGEELRILFPWKRGIQDLVHLCNPLPKIHVRIYGYNEDWFPWWKWHEELVELRSILKNHIVSVELGLYEGRMAFNNEEGREHTLEEMEEEILAWLRS